MWSDQNEDVVVLNQMLSQLAGSAVGKEMMFVDGMWTKGASSGLSGVENPTDESLVAFVPEGTGDDAIAALEAARRAQPACSRSTA